MSAATLTTPSAKVDWSVPPAGALRPRPRA